MTTDPSAGPTGGTTINVDETGPVGHDSGFIFDVGEMPSECEGAQAGFHCKDNVATECDGNGNVASIESCIPGVCVPGTGCVVCLAGQFHCSGPRVMECDANAVPPRWVDVELCDPTMGEGCDQELGTCEPLAPIGNNTPTGEYYQYASFPNGVSGYQGGFDVDAFEDKLYVTDLGGTHVDVYLVTIEDSDNDGEVEPNQHPDNPDEMGPIEQRTIAYVESIPNVAVYDVGLIASEIYAIDDRMWVGGANLTEYVFGVPGSQNLSAAPVWSYFGQGVLSQIAYDEISGVWYASNEAGRRVLQWDEETDSWGIAFLFPDLAGSHMDGLEVVTDPNTGVPYVYVSDMTSDFIGQYRLDAELGWVQENMFQYAGTVGESVEGMGFGTFNHFWITGYQAVYEIGGGDLSTYTEPTPTG